MIIHYFSDALIAARKKKGLSKSQVAESFGWMGMHYGRFEKGHIFPTKANIGKFANLMDMSIDDVQKLIDLEKSVRKGYFNNREHHLHPEILENWKIIVIDSKKHKLFEVDIKQLGIALKTRRQECGLYRNEAARFAGINPRTLRCYEDGEREISIISFYKLMQLYEVGDISDFLMRCSENN